MSQHIAIIVMAIISALYMVVPFVIAFALLKMARALQSLADSRKDAR